MVLLWQYFLFTSIIFLAAVIEGVVGFGGCVLALPFLSLFLDINKVVPVLMLLIVVNSSLRLITGFRAVVWKYYLVMVFITFLGIPLGQQLLAVAPENLMKGLLGGLVFFVAWNGLRKLHDQPIQTKKLLSQRTKYLFAVAALFLGGVMQGAFACGGPLMVIYLTMALPNNKNSFRMTMFATGLTTSLLVTLQNLRNHLFVGDTLNLTLWMLPALLLAFFISNHLQQKIPEGSFITVIYRVLAIIGVLLMGQTFLMWKC